VSLLGFDPPDFDLMFQPGNRYRLPDGAVAVVEVLDAGLLHLPTGRVVACDPYFGSAVHEYCTAFTVTVKPGRYPVTLSVARTDWPDPDMSSPLLLGAAARLTVLDEPVVTWELALQPGQDPAALGEDEIYCFGVDSGKGSFFDSAAVGAVALLEDQAIDLEKGDFRPEHKRFLHELKRNAFANLVVDPVADLNIVIFRCGLGDGCYAIWIGRTATGQPACFVADLRVLSDSFGPLIE
jgi:Protein of unknown function (DUF4241)